MLTKKERKALKQRFWSEFEKHCDAVPELTGRKKKWILHDTKISHLDLKFDISGNSILVALEINHKSELRRFQVFEVLEKYKSLLSQGCEGVFTWDFCYQNENGQEVCRIYVEKRETDIYNTGEWPLIFQFLAGKMLLLQNNFIEIQEFLKEELDLLHRER